MHLNLVRTYILPETSYTPATLKIREGEKMIRGGGKFFYLHDLAEQIVCRKKS